ncbi:hypothetical protein ACWD3J_47555 [Streptomyces sp. NPDC002755]|uniref:hypothetical protein n=1 Tax=Streptomyces sp. NPDC002884 TaxID=3154544 RepID=UPI0033214AF4
MKPVSSVVIQIGAGAVSSHMYRMEWTQLIDLLLRRRVAASQERQLAAEASAHDVQRARAAAEAAVSRAVRRGEGVVLVADVVRQAEEQFLLRLSTQTAAQVLDQIAARHGLTSDAADR